MMRLSFLCYGAHAIVDELPLGVNGSRAGPLTTLEFADLLVWRNECLLNGNLSHALVLLSGSALSLNIGNVIAAHIDFGGVVCVAPISDDLAIHGFQRSSHSPLQLDRQDLIPGTCISQSTAIDRQISALQAIFERAISTDRPVYVVCDALLLAQFNVFDTGVEDGHGIRWLGRSHNFCAVDVTEMVATELRARIRAALPIPSSISTRIDRVLNSMGIVGRRNIDSAQMDLTHVSSGRHLGVLLGQSIEFSLNLSVPPMFRPCHGATERQLDLFNENAVNYLIWATRHMADL